MRIITGSLRGRTIPFTTRRSGNIRITSSILKEALFSMLGTDLDDHTFLDLCAGCGQIGLEAYSRGASTILNEPDGRRFAQLKRLAVGWRLKGLELHALKAQVLIDQLQDQGRQVDLIYLDPPYRAQLRSIPLSLALLDDLGHSKLLAPQGHLLVQHQKELEAPQSTGHLDQVRQRSYGQTTLSIYQRTP